MIYGNSRNEEPFPNPKENSTLGGYLTVDCFEHLDVMLGWRCELGIESSQFYFQLANPVSMREKEIKQSYDGGYE